jgi:hypothetical protein
MQPGYASDDGAVIAERVAPPRRKRRKPSARRRKHDGRRWVVRRARARKNEPDDPFGVHTVLPHFQTGPENGKIKSRDTLSATHVTRRGAENPGEALSAVVRPSGDGGST